MVKKCITKQQQCKQEKLVLNRQWEKLCVVTAFLLVDRTKRSIRFLSQQLWPVPVWLLDPNSIPVLFSFLAQSQTLLLKFVLQVNILVKQEFPMLVSWLRMETGNLSLCAFLKSPPFISLPNSLFYLPPSLLFFVAVSPKALPVFQVFIRCVSDALSSASGHAILAYPTPLLNSSGFFCSQSQQSLFV